MLDCQLKMTIQYKSTTFFDAARKSEVRIYKRKQELDQESDQENKKTRKKTKTGPRKRQKKRKTFLLLDHFLGRVLVFF